MAEITTDRMRRALAATRAGWKRASDEEVRKLWTRMSEEDREDALAIADGKEPPNQKRREQEREAERRRAEQETEAFATEADPNSEQEENA